MRGVRVKVGATSLMYACQQGKESQVIDIIQTKPGTVLERERSLKTALHYCAESGDGGVESAGALLRAAPELVHAQDQDGYTALHLAVIAGNIHLAKLLLANGTNVNTPDNEGHTSAHWATVCGEIECLDLILKKGGDANIGDMHGGCPLHYAAQMCGPGSEMPGDRRLGMAALRLLIDYSANPNIPDNHGRQPILWAASAGSSEAILVLTNAGANVEASDKDGLTALHCAASRGHTDCVETLISLCNAEADVIDNNGCSALFYAVTLGHADSCQALLNHGANTNRQDRKGRTAMHCGAAKGQMETLKVVWSRGGNLWTRTARGDYPLHEAVTSGRLELVSWLLSLRPDTVNAPNNDGRCPLHLAAIHNNVEMCKVLLDAGSLVNPVMRTGKGLLATPLDAALHKGHRGTAKYLQLHGGVPAGRLNSESAALRGPNSRNSGMPSQQLVEGEMERNADNLGNAKQNTSNQHNVTFPEKKQKILQVYVDEGVMIKKIKHNPTAEADERVRRRRRKRKSRFIPEKCLPSEKDRYKKVQKGSTDDEAETSPTSSVAQVRRKVESDSDNVTSNNASPLKNKESILQNLSIDRESKHLKDHIQEVKVELHRPPNDINDDIIKTDINLDGEIAQTLETDGIQANENEERVTNLSKEEAPDEIDINSQEDTTTVQNEDSLNNMRGDPNSNQSNISLDNSASNNQDISEDALKIKNMKNQEKNELNTSENVISNLDASETMKDSSLIIIEGDGEINDASIRPDIKSSTGFSNSETNENNSIHDTSDEMRVEPGQKNEVGESGKNENSCSEQRDIVSINETRVESSQNKPEHDSVSDSLAVKESKSMQKDGSFELYDSLEEGEIQGKENQTTSKLKFEQNNETNNIIDQGDDRNSGSKDEVEIGSASIPDQLDHNIDPRSEEDNIQTQKYDNGGLHEASNVIETEGGEIHEKSPNGKTKHDSVEGLADVNGNKELSQDITDNDSQESGNSVVEKIGNINVINAEDGCTDNTETKHDNNSRVNKDEESIITEDSTNGERKNETITNVGSEDDSEKQSASIEYNSESSPNSQYESKDVVSLKGENSFIEEDAGDTATLINTENYKSNKSFTIITKSRNIGGEGNNLSKKSSNEEGNFIEDGIDNIVNEKMNEDAENPDLDEVLDKENIVKVVPDPNKFDKNVHKDKAKTTKRNRSKGIREASLDNNKNEVDTKISHDNDKGLIKVLDDENIPSDKEKSKTKTKRKEWKETRSNESWEPLSLSPQNEDEKSNSGSRSPTEPSHFHDSGIEPSPQRGKKTKGLRSKSKSRIPRMCNRKSDDDVPVSTISVTQAVQYSVRKYHLERRIFHQLLELKRLQIRAGRASESVLVKRLVDDYKRAGLMLGLQQYNGVYTFRAFEKYLYDQLRLLQSSERRIIPRLKSSDDLEKLTAALKKTRAGQNLLTAIPNNPVLCTYQTHRCDHATHAYTGIPCAAYLRRNHHTMPKAGSFLPKLVHGDKTGELAKTIRFVDPARPLTLELSHGSEKQVITLPTEKLDKSKRYFVTFTIKTGNKKNPEGNGGHIHASSV